MKIEVVVVFAYAGRWRDGAESKGRVVQCSAVQYFSWRL